MQNPPSTFRLLDLPEPVIFEVWKFLHTDEQFSLATTSSRFKNLASGFFKTHHFQLALLFADDFQLAISKRDEDDFFGIRGPERFVYPKLAEILKFTKPCQRSNFWSTLFRFIELLRELFGSLDVVLSAYTDKRRQENTRTLLETLARMNLQIQVLNFHAFNVDADLYEQILDQARETADARINVFVDPQQTFEYMKQAMGSPTGSLRGFHISGNSLAAPMGALTVSVDSARGSSSSGTPSVGSSAPHPQRPSLRGPSLPHRSSPIASPSPITPFKARNLTLHHSEFVTVWHLTTIFLNVGSLALNGCNLGSRQIGVFLKKWVEGSEMKYLRISYNGRWVKAIFEMHPELEGEMVAEAVIDGSFRNFHEGECYMIRQANGTKALIYWDIYFYLNVVD